jgi:hypothetical protein
MGPRPSTWGTDRSAAPPSITHGNAVAKPLHDATDPKGGQVAVSGSGDAWTLFDNTSRTETVAAGATPAVEYGFGSSREIGFYTLTNASGDAALDPRDWVLKGSNDGRRWQVVDARRGEAFRWRTQTRPFKVADPGDYRRYRIEFSGAGAGGVGLAEVELLTRNTYAATPLMAEVDSQTSRPGRTVPVHVTVTNTGSAPARGDVTLSAPAGWTVDPATAAFGPIAAGQSQVVTVQVAVPATAAPGSYPIRAVVSSGQSTARAAGGIQVVGDVIEFSPGDAGEAPWLFEDNGSRLTTFNGRSGRYADNAGWFTYRFDVTGVTGGSVTLDIGNEFEVWASTDNASWTSVLREPTEEHNLTNLQPRTLDLNTLRGGSSATKLYLRVGDSKTDDGWGGWLAHVRLETTGG